MEKKGSLLVVFILVFFLNGARSDIIPLEHYDASEKFICVKSLSLYLDRAILMKFSDNYLRSWPGNSDFDCKSTVFSKTSETGIIAVIQALNFRKNSQCVDYVRFDVDPTDRCGDITFGLKKTLKGQLPPPPSFVSRYPGPFQKGQTLYMEEVFDSHGRVNRVDSRRNIVSPGAAVEPHQKLQTSVHVGGLQELAVEEDLHFTIAYTGYQNCEKTNVTEDLFNCGFGVCILAIYVNDGVVNCPFGDCKDEGSCEEAMETSPFFTGNQNNPEVAGKMEDVAVRLRKHHKAATGILVRSMGDSARTAEDSLQIAKEVKSLKEEFVEQNRILGHLSDVIERAAGAMVDVERKQTTVPPMRKSGSSTVSPNSGHVTTAKIQQKNTQ